MMGFLAGRTVSRRPVWGETSQASASASWASVVSKPSSPPSLASDGDIVAGESEYQKAQQPYDRNL
jgi:hypothetical protein